MTLEVVIHYDEIGLKGKNRPFFERRLSRNVATALSEIASAVVRPIYGRILLATEEDASWPRISQALAYVFGIAHFGRVWRSASELDAMRAVALELLPRDPGIAFAVKARRADKSFPHRSIEISRCLGAAIQADRGWRVDLSNPDLTLQVTVMGKQSLLSWEKMPGPGGLPAGSSGKAVCLLSGGIDSPVAAFRVMRRGVSPVFVHFHSYPYTEKASQEGVRRLAQLLLRGQPPRPLWLVPLAEIQQRIIGECKPDFRVLLYRRFMLRLASKIAWRERARAIVTGEVIGQVASQTLENMAALEACVGLPVLRPLLGFDKREIVEAARRLGTFEVRSSGRDDCCSYLLPPRPATKSRAEDLAAAEEALPLAELIDDALSRSERTVISGLPPG